MSSIKMTALRKHPFGTGEREMGEEYEATPDESAILIALGWAKKTPAKAAEKPLEKLEKLPAEKKPEVVKKVVEAEASDKKRAYQRRDMKAKD